MATMTVAQCSPAADAIEELRNRRPVILVDDEPDGPGWLVFAAADATSDIVRFSEQQGTGPLFAALAPTFYDRLNLPTPNPVTNRTHRANGVSVSLVGLPDRERSVAARAATLRLLGWVGARAGDISQPGHIFPVRADPDGVRATGGCVEAAAELCRLAGLGPASGLVQLAESSAARRGETDRSAESTLTQVSLQAVLTAQPSSSASGHPGQSETS